MLRSLVAACAAALALGACGSGERWTPEPIPVCTTAVREPVLPSEMVQDLGTLQVGARASFTVAADTTAFFVFSQEAANSAPDTTVVSGIGRVPNAVVPTDLRAPDDTLFYDDLAAWPTTVIGTEAYWDATGLLAYDLGSPSSATFPVPNTSGALARLAQDRGVQPGTWTFEVNDWAFELGGNRSGRYRVHVVTRPPQVGVPTLDLEVYLATDETSDLPSAAAARASPRAARWEQGLAHYLSKAGITLGVVRYNDLPREVKDRYAPNGEVSLAGFGPCSPLSRLFSSAIERRRAVHLFLADGLDRGGVAGVAGAIPGPSGFPGAVYGGAIVGIEDLDQGSLDGAGACSGAIDLGGCGPDRIAYVAAHEIGHWLGLYHPTEQDGTFFDPVSDTDRCACLSCAPAPLRDGCAEVAKASATTVVLNSDCTAGGTCGGGENLMFWLLDPGHSTGELSDDQRRIVQLNPAVR
jgi:hypothetical protein